MRDALFWVLKYLKDLLIFFSFKKFETWIEKNNAKNTLWNQEVVDQVINEKCKYMQCNQIIYH